MIEFEFSQGSLWTQSNDFDQISHLVHFSITVDYVAVIKEVWLQFVFFCFASFPVQMYDV